jgi:ABC-type nitrate/sulfonate/bicarbonate transport system substrate-binding protein
MKVEFRIVKKLWISLGLALLIACGLRSAAKAQALEKVLITHSSDKVMSQPLTGPASSKDKAEKNPQQLKKMLRGFLRTLRAVREDKRGVTEFIAKKFVLDTNAADETYKIMLQTMSDDGMVSEADLKDLLEQAKHETGTKRDVALKEIVDYSLLRQVTRETGR